MQPIGNEFENITVDEQHEDHSFGHFDLNEIAAAFPATAETLLLDTYLTNEDAASARVFRVYRGTPPHYHAGSDEYLYVLSGKGTFWMGSPANAGAFAPGSSCSSSAAPSTPCQRSVRVPWYSYR
jgi:mannose-6-phosphate isomerase-like protein (cupin superfamily)